MFESLDKATQKVLPFMFDGLYPEVSPGQIWTSPHWKSGQCWLKVINIDNFGAYCYYWDTQDSKYYNHWSKTVIQANWKLIHIPIDVLD